ncbi:MAG: hypothetical protein H0X67_12290 [Acidobacteria bacterium]|nr:hypothetical protein [Acidobacteriota bacterium]
MEALLEVRDARGDWEARLFALAATHRLDGCIDPVEHAGVEGHGWTAGIVLHPATPGSRPSAVPLTRPGR